MAASLKDEIKSSVTNGKCNNDLEYVWPGEADLSRPEKKSIVELSLRQVLVELLQSDGFSKQLLVIIDQAIHASIKDVSIITTPLALLEDLCDCLVIAECETVFEYLESKLAVWTEVPFVDSTPFKNNMLRLCNSIKRKLSKSLHTVFSGRILMFLAAVTPLTDKSGVNLRSTNSTNKIEYDEAAGKPKDSAKDADAMDSGKDDQGNEGVDGGIDFGFYHQFWKLQRFFLDPKLVNDAREWLMFKKCTKTFLDAAASLKLEGMSSNAGDEYFTKFLTSVKLFNLQQADSAFRRQVLVQFLILFQGVTTTNKFRKQDLTPTHHKWIDATNTQIYELLGKTPPEEKQFEFAIKQLFSREKFWIEWKNKGCQPYEKDRTSVSLPKGSAKRRRSTDMDTGTEAPGAKKHKEVQLGSPELDRLWNLTKTNMEGCLGKPGTLLPSVETFFEIAKMELDPNECVEEEYWKIKDPTFGWRSLRLLARNHLQLFAAFDVNDTEESVKTFLQKCLVADFHFGSIPVKRKTAPKQAAKEPEKAA